MSSQTESVADADDTACEQALEQFLNDGGTFAMLKDISSDDLEQLYSLAFNHYQSGKWEEAQTVFKGLCVLNHYDLRFFLGLGACRQALGLFDEALQNYSYGALLDLNDPRFPFHSGECHLQLGNLEAAESGFYCAGILAAALPDYLALAECAKVMLDVVLMKKEHANVSD